MLGEGAAEQAPSAGARRYAMGLLFTAYVVNYIDRQIVTILQEPIKADLGLSDTQLGLMTGLAFALFYATMGVPIARIADRRSRRGVIAAATALWSAMTMACGAAGSFATLLFARVGVGVGEAGLSPPAHSLISDYYPPEKRGAALGLYSSGIQVGVMLGFLIGGLMQHYFGWRAAFLVVGAPGLLLALLIRFTLVEPQRGRFDPAPSVAPLGFGAALRELWSIKPFRYAAFACGFHTMVLYGHGHWSPPYLGRVHDMPLPQIGMWLAILAIGPGALGLWLSGVISDRLQRRYARARIWVPIGSMLLLIPFEIAYVLAPSVEVALVCSAVTHFLGGVYLAPTIAFAHSLVGPTLRASASAMLLLGLNLIGLGVGPLLVGRVSDLLMSTEGVDSVRYAMLAVVPAQAIALVFFALAARNARSASS
jgi:MFS family permease